MHEGHIEYFYFNLDIIPTAIIFGIALLLVICLIIAGICDWCIWRLKNKTCNENKCFSTCETCHGWINCNEKCNICFPEVNSCCKVIKRLCSELIKLMYADEFYLIKTKEEENLEHRSGFLKLYVGGKLLRPEFFCLYYMLITNSLLLVFFFAMVFTDYYFVDAFPGCFPNYDCYITNADFNEYPIQNCSDLKSNEDAICYSLKLEAQPALSAVGGLSIMIRLMVVFLSRLIVFCINKVASTRCKSLTTFRFGCCSVFMQLFCVGMPFLIIAGLLLWGINVGAHENPYSIGSSISFNMQLFY